MDKLVSIGGRKTRVDGFILVLILALLLAYLWGMQTTGGFTILHAFSSNLAMDVAQVARNTLHGNFLETKYILPVGYMYFPAVDHHPDFIRYPFLILLYTLLFAIFSPDPAVIKLLNGVLFLCNGWLMYRLALKLQRPGEGAEIINPLKNSLLSKKVMALMAALLSSIWSARYYEMALADNYEVVSFTLLMIFLNVMLERTAHPLAPGLLGGALYLTKPTFALLIFVFELYYLLPRFRSRQWFTAGLLSVLGFGLVIAPFVARSLWLTGEPVFALQNKVDIIKEVTQSHDELFKSFARPPDALPVILSHKAVYLQRWETRVQAALQNMQHLYYLPAWVGLPFFFILFKRQRIFVISYLAFLALHVIVVANYLVIADVERVYAPFLTFCLFLGSLGLLQTVLVSIARIVRWSPAQNLAVLAVFIVLMFAIAIKHNADLRLDSAAGVPTDVVQKVRAQNPPCLYSNTPFSSAWYLDIPTIYKPVDNQAMLTAGPEECHYFLYRQASGTGQLKSFLDENGRLVFQSGNFAFYTLRE